MAPASRREALSGYVAGGALQMCVPQFVRSDRPSTSDNHLGGEEDPGAGGHAHRVVTPPAAAVFAPAKAA